MTTTSISPWPWLMLIIRSLLFIAFQALIYKGLMFTGSARAWEITPNYWPLTVLLTNLVCIALLVRLFQVEGKRYWDIFRFERRYWKTDLLVMLGILLVAVPVAILPSILIVDLFYGYSQTPFNIFFRILPLWAVIAGSIFFALTQGLAEMPTYFGYCMPRIAKITGHSWLALLLCAIALGLQHLPWLVLFDGGYLTRQIIIYIETAFLVAIILLWRPRLLPYMVIVQILIDILNAQTLLRAQTL